MDQETISQEDIPESLSMKIQPGHNGKIQFFGDPEFIRACTVEWRRKDAEKQTKLSGSYGQVFKVMVGGVNYFVKFLQETDDSFEKGREMFAREVVAAIKLTRDVPWAVSNLKGAVYAEDPDKKLVKLYLIFEAPEGYNLREYLDLITHEFLQQNGLYPSIYCSINTAREAVNNLGYVHRDIKPENIFVEVDPLDKQTFIRCKLIDLGFVVPIGTRTGRAGTPRYWPRTMNNYNTYISTHDAKANVYHNIHSVETIWTKDFQQTGSPPRNCAEIDLYAATTLAYPPIENSNDEDIPLLMPPRVPRPPPGPSPAQLRTTLAKTIVGALARAPKAKVDGGHRNRATKKRRVSSRRTRRLNK